MVEAASTEKLSPTQLLQQSRIQLKHARAAYGQIFLTEKNRGVRAFGINKVERSTDQEFLRSQRTYETARDTYLDVVARNKGVVAAEQASVVEKTEFKRSTRDSVVFWSLVALGLGAVAAGAWATSPVLLLLPQMIGKGYLINILAGITVSLSLRYIIIPKWLAKWDARWNPFYKFDVDSKTVVDRKKKIETEWSEEKDNRSVSFATFRAKHTKAFRKIKRGTRVDRWIRTAAISTPGVAASLTGVRAGFMMDAARYFGDEEVYGDRIISKIISYTRSYVGATMFGMPLPQWEDVAAIEDARHFAELSGIRQIPDSEIERLPFSYDPEGPNLRYRTLTVIETHITWAKRIIAWYRNVMPIDDDGWFQRNTLKDLNENLRRLERARDFIERGASVEDMRHNTDVTGFRLWVQPFYNAAYILNSGPDFGHYFADGQWRRISDMPGVSFKHGKDFSKLPKSMGRALYLFIHDERVNGGSSGMTVTEGHDPDQKLSYRHLSWCHRTGNCVDIRPSRAYMSDPSYVYRVLVMQLHSSHYTIRYEPFDLDPHGRIRAYIKFWLTMPKLLYGEGMTERQAERFLDDHYGNVPPQPEIGYKGTNGPHFHLQAEAPVNESVPLEPRHDRRWDPKRYPKDMPEESIWA